MPLAMLRYQAGDSAIARVAKAVAVALPRIIAPQLSTGADEEHGKLTPKEIEVWCNEGSVNDVNTQPIEIVIFAHDYPERRSNLEDRKNAIIKGVIRKIEEQGWNLQFESKGFVWIVLAETAFGRILKK